jgi:hypothetical protein
MHISFRDIESIIKKVKSEAGGDRGPSEDTCYSGIKSKSKTTGSNDFQYSCRSSNCIRSSSCHTPALSKRFLKAIEEEYPDLTYFALASGSTGAGVINHCFENPPRFLIDEIEDMKQSDQATLLLLLQDGRLVETKVS